MKISPKNKSSIKIFQKDKNRDFNLQPSCTTRNVKGNSLAEGKWYQREAWISRKE